MSTKSKERGGALIVVILLLGGLVGAGGAGLYWWRARTDEQQRVEAARAREAEHHALRAAEDARRAALEGERAMRQAPMPRAKPAPDPAVLAEQKRQAHRSCQTIAQAMESYALNGANPGMTREECLPKSISDLLTPPFGGPSFLRNGKADTLDPWGKPYQLEPHKHADGTFDWLVLCFGPDNVPISQFGIGDQARPRNALPK